LTQAAIAQSLLPQFVSRETGCKTLRRLPIQAEGEGTRARAFWLLRQGAKRCSQGVGLLCFIVMAVCRNNLDALLSQPSGLRLRLARKHARGMAHENSSGEQFRPLTPAARFG